MAEEHLKAFPKFSGNTSVLSMMGPEAQAKAVDAILADADADKAAKAGASFVRVMAAKDDAAKFDALAEEHEKAFPDFPGNRELESTRKQAAADKVLKEKPLDLKFTSVSGKEIDLSKMRGKVILVDFWATWCGPCMAEMPTVVATYEKLHGKGFEIIGISFDKDKAALEKITKESKMTWEQYFDGEGWKNKFGQQYGINSIPRMWLVDKKGMVVDTNGRKDLEKKIEKLLAE
jgi:thiol-disulfide isomerase/thioredoxin